MLLSPLGEEFKYLEHPQSNFIYTLEVGGIREYIILFLIIFLIILVPFYIIYRFIRCKRNK